MLRLPRLSKWLQVWPIWESGWIENKLPPWQEEEMQRQRHRRQREAAARLDR